MENQVEVTETVEVISRNVACNGDDGALGHPKVYLHIKPGHREIVCPYCSRRFALTEKD